MFIHRSSPIKKRSDRIGCNKTWVRLIFYSIQLSLRSFDLTQLVTHNGFKRLDANQPTTQNRFLKFDSNRLKTKKLTEFYSNQLTTQKTFQNLDSNQLVTQWCNSFPVSFDLFGAFNLNVNWLTFFKLSTKCDFRMTFWGAFDSSVFQTNWFESANDSSSISERLEMI